VAAASGDDAVAELSSPLQLTVTPAFYQTKWFYTICVLVVLSLLYVAYLMRIQYVTNRLKERLKERSSERIRIARELHDTLLQSIHGLMLRFHFATEALPQDEPARQSLQVALSRADEVILEGRRRVQDLRDEVSDATDFATQIAAVATELVQDRSGSTHEYASSLRRKTCGHRSHVCRQRIYDAMLRQRSWPFALDLE
jgi:signal transduction histidine kinase